MRTTVFFKFDHAIGSKSCHDVDQLFIRRTQKDLDNYCLSQSYFDLSKRSIKNNSNIMYFFKQFLRDVENISRDVAGYGTNYFERRDSCRKA